MATWKDKEAAIRALEHRGRVDPNDLIEAARDPAHPCHSDFTWDVEEAAKERWRDQARKLIRQCKFEVEFLEVTRPVAQYIANPDSEDADDFVSVPKMRKQSQVNAAMLYEINSLLGLASRIHGLAIAKENIVGSRVVSQLTSVVELVKAIKDDIEG